MPALMRTLSPDELSVSSSDSGSNEAKRPRQLGDLLGGATRLLLEVSQPYPGDEAVPADDERRRAPRFDVIRVSSGTYVIRDEFFDRMTILPLGYLMVSAFSLASWYANIQAEELGIEGFDFLRTHRVRVQELLESEVQRYLAERIGEYPFLAETSVRRVLRDPEDPEDSLEMFLVRIPIDGEDFVEFLSQNELTNSCFDLIGWMLTRPARDNLGSLFGDFLVPEEEPELYASMPRIPDRIVAKPIVVVTMVNGQPARALIDSGSLGDLISTTIADQLRLKRNELEEPIVLQLAVQGSRSRINHSSTSRT